MADALSDKELDFFRDPHIMPMKARVWEKVESHLSVLQTDLREDIRQHTRLPSYILESSPKLSRGENYREQPYRVLDYPRAFQKTDVFMFRTIVLWGFPIGIHLILQGTYKDIFQEKILIAQNHNLDDFYICLEESQWEWIYEKDAYLPVIDYTDQALPQDFLKISQFFPIEEYTSLPEFGLKAWRNICQVLF